MILVPVSAILLNITSDAVDLIETVARTCYQSEPKGEPGDLIRKLLGNGHMTPIRSASATMRFIADRGVIFELVRHQIGSGMSWEEVFCQESTRFCNYSQKRFGVELTFIEDEDTDFAQGSVRSTILKMVETAYMSLVSSGEKAQKARDLLPQLLKTQIDCTMTFEAWLHFFDLRWYGLTGAPHPRMQRMAGKALAILREQVPEVFGIDAFDIRWTGQRDRLNQALLHLGEERALGLLGNACTKEHA